MQLDESSVRGVVDFLEGYARRCLEEVEELRRSTDGPGDESWVLLMDAASAFREAGQWCLLFDVERSRQLLVRAGVIYSQFNLGFGYYLLAVAEPAQLGELRRGIGRSFARLSGGAGFTERSEVGEPAVEAALNYPQQQAYLLLAGVVAGEDDDELRGMVQTVLTESPHSVGVSPVGALGIPIRRFWSLASALAGDVREAPMVGGTADTGPISAVVEHVHDWIAKYVQSVELAMANEHCWRHAAAPVDVVDLDICGTIALAASQLGLGQVMDGMTTLAEDLPPLGRVQIQLGQELAGYGYREGVMG
ncbi:hypothetical protein [Lentzea sp. NBRC 105346]|uniref:hypothetical protein n=1 Tax=Lentzea sp. NBRC 105346 TaxID=3032205 RepID=UPI0025545949|nr:hypothetical protein [Lentzea sp. NBRC 105346]